MQVAVVVVLFHTVVARYLTMMLLGVLVDQVVVVMEA
jgi:hypothetical protein